MRIVHELRGIAYRSFFVCIWRLPRKKKGLRTWTQPLFDIWMETAAPAWPGPTGSDGRRRQAGTVPFLLPVALTAAVSVSAAVPVAPAATATALAG